MKKTLAINLNGTMFNIDEDAYQLLDDYLRNLRIYFRKEEDSVEVLVDFEARIAELFNERMRLGYSVVSIEQVKEVIERIGNPEDFGVADAAAEEDFFNAKARKEPEGKKRNKKLYRDIHDKMFGGICSGISNYFGWDPTPLRIILFILIFVTSLWIIPVYLVLWIFLPAAKTAEQQLEMKGEEITLENIGKTVSETPEEKKKGFGNAIVTFIVAVLKICLVGAGCLIGIPLIFAIIIVLIVLFALFAGGGSTVVPFADFLGFDGQFLAISNPIPAFIAITLLVAIPLVMIIYSIVAYFGKLKPIPVSVKWASFAVWLIALFALIFFGVKLTKDYVLDPSNNGKWNVTWTTNSRHGSEIIENSGVLAEIDTVLPVFKKIKLSDNMSASVKLVQTKDTQPRILINGDSNIINEIGWNVSDDGTLNLFVKKDYRISMNGNTIIKITTPVIEGIENESFGSVVAESAIKSDVFSIVIDGAGKFNADTLVAKNLIVDVSGVGTVSVSGKAQNSRLSLEGTGKIDVLELESDTVFAKLEGVGSIKCNPKNSLDAKVEGVGKITYKSEPKSKNASIEGVGKIGLE